MNTMEAWIAEVCTELGLDLADQKATTAQVLDLTKDVAHGVARPAAPVTAFLIGLAAARTDDPDRAVADLCARLATRARGWSGEG